MEVFVMLLCVLLFQWRCTFWKGIQLSATGKQDRAIPYI